jgi:hypothetical protein
MVRKELVGKGGVVSMRKLMVTVVCALVLLFLVTMPADASTVEISQTSGSAFACFGQSEAYVNVGQGQSFFVDETGSISEIQIYLTVVKGNPKTDQIICDLRDSEGTVLQSLSIEGFSTGGGWKSFGFDKKVTPGNYIFTCYLHNSYTLEMHHYSIHGNANDNSYLDGTRYVSTGGRPEDWSTWKPEPWDLKFKVILTLTDPPKTPDAPDGETYGYTKTSYTYSTSTTDPDNDQIKYIFDWGDGNQDTTEFVDSSSSVAASHSWTNPGTYSVKTKARDSSGEESGWSEVLTVTITPAPTPTLTATTQTPSPTTQPPTPGTDQMIPLIVALIGAIAVIIAALINYLTSRKTK